MVVLFILVSSFILLSGNLADWRVYKWLRGRYLCLLLLWCSLVIIIHLDDLYLSLYLLWSRRNNLSLVGLFFSLYLFGLYSFILDFCFLENLEYLNGNRWIYLFNNALIIICCVYLLRYLLLSNRLNYLDANFWCFSFIQIKFSVSYRLLFPIFLLRFSYNIHLLIRNQILKISFYMMNGLYFLLRTLFFLWNLFLCDFNYLSLFLWWFVSIYFRIIAFFKRNISWLSFNLDLLFHFWKLLLIFLIVIYLLRNRWCYLRFFTQLCLILDFTWFWILRRTNLFYLYFQSLICCYVFNRYIFW